MNKLLSKLRCKLIGHKWILIKPDGEWTKHLYNLGYRKYICEDCGYEEIKHVDDLKC